jgi:hypothetical protein
MTEILIADLEKACGAPQSRISETAAGLGMVRGNMGRQLRRLTVADAIKVAIVRELMAAGLTAAAALDIGRQVREADLADIIAHERRMWLLVRRDPTGQSEYTFTLADLQEATDIIASEPDDVVAQVTAGEQPRNIRIVDVFKVVRAVLAAALERKQAAAAKEPTTTVTTYNASQKASGIVLEGLDLAIVRYGKGTRIRLTASEARALGEKLIAAAEGHGDTPPEKMN